MKAIVYFIGIIPMFLSIIMICSANWWTPVGFVLAFLTWASSKTENGGKFWSKWLQINDQINNAIAPRRKDGAK